MTDQPIATPAAPATPPTPDPAAPPPLAAAEDKKDFLAPKFAALAKKERQIRMQAQQSKMREQAFAKREAELAERERVWNDEFKASPLEALKKRNLTYQDLTNAALNDGKFDPSVEIKDVKQEIQRLRQENQDKEAATAKQAQEQAAAAEQQAIENFQEQIVSHVGANKDKYELTQLYDASDLVYQTVEEHFSRTKKILAIPEACDLVEQYLESELERTAKESKKFQSKFGAAKVDDAKSSGKSSTTLSNSLSSSSAPSILPQKTEDDRMRRAMAKLELGT